MKAGSAISGKEPTEVNAIWTNLIGFSSRYKKEIMAETPKATVIGAPMRRRARKAPNRIKTMVVSISLFPPIGGIDSASPPSAAW